jgi:hypothetical protein
MIRPGTRYSRVTRSSKGKERWGDSRNT